ncbi:MAG: glycosyltransferase family 2 protein [Anaerolineae bacterium]|nr:glycosyltransferase family 2 protein [Anaerolineae bacterium]
MRNSNHSNSTVGISAIVCAYNEEKTLGGVLAALLDTPDVSEIIVIDDGSADGTVTVVDRYARHPRIRGVVFPTNQGKGAAMAEGILLAQGEVLLFVDADLYNFEPRYAYQILIPLLDGEAGMVIGWPRRGNNPLDILDPFRPLSGQRAAWRRDLLPLAPIIREAGYGVETLMNLYYRREGLRMQYVALDGLFHPIKAEKFGPLGTLHAYLFEGWQIVRATLRHSALVLEAFGLRSGAPRLGASRPGLACPRSGPGRG